MSEPAWVALGAQPVDYEGEWAVGTQYAPGDVVRYNGIEYLAVNPSLGVVPPAALGGGRELAYGEYAADLALPTAGADIITLAPLALDGVTPILIEFSGTLSCPVNTGFGVDLYDGAVNLGKLGGSFNLDSYILVRGSRRLTPAAGSHTYKVRGYGITNPVTLYVTTGGNVPAYLRVTRA